MKKSSFKIQIIRNYIGRENEIYIKGFYYNGAEKDVSIKFLADEEELEYTERDISDYDINNRYKKEDASISSGSIFVVKMPKVETYKAFSVSIEGDGINERIVELPNEMLGEMLKRTYYSIDAMERVGDILVIRGWCVSKSGATLSVRTSDGSDIKAKTVLYERNDVSIEYSEIGDEYKVEGFSFEFNYECPRNIVFEMKYDDNKLNMELDTKSDFEGNRSFTTRVKKSIKTRGLVGTFVYALKKLRHPVKLMKKFSRKFGITALLKRIGKFFDEVKKNIKEERVLRKEYNDLRKVYPNATKKMLHLKDLDKLKVEKQLHKTGDVKYSILVPLFNTPVQFLNEMIESVQIQTYENWELCLADGSDDKHSYVGKICSKYQKNDCRIVYKKLDKNYGISGNTNECIKMATGNYIALFDHDDFLHPFVLQKCYDVIKEKGADFVYTDEATFQLELSNVVTYHYKPDYAPDNLRANNYICHFSTFSKELLDKAGWYDSKYDGSQDHDLILRLTENAKCIEHIQEILYFWRSHPGSVAEDINSKTYAIDAGKRAVLASIERNGMTAVVESSKAFPTIYRIKYDLITRPMISIVIPNCNHVEDLRRCIDSIQSKSTYSNYEIIIVENNSTDDSIFEYYNELKNVQGINVLKWEREFNYSAINNFAVKEAKGDYILFLNNDIEVITPEWMEEMVMYAQRKDVAAVGAKLYYPDNTIQHAGIVLGLGAHRVAGHVHYKCEKNNLGYMGRLYYSQDMSAVTAACMLIKKSIFEQIGGFDEKFVVAYNDIDLCVKALEAGYLNIFTPHAELYHYESASRGMEDTPEKKERFNREVSRFKEKWKEVLDKGDKYFNKNFSLDDSWFVFKENNLFKK